jgi:hypothetical protein
MRAPRFTVIFVLLTSFSWSQQYQYPFQNPALPVEARINNILSLMTLDEKVSALSTSPDVPRLGIQGSGCIACLVATKFRIFAVLFRTKIGREPVISRNTFLGET